MKTVHWNLAAALATLSLIFVAIAPTRAVAQTEPMQFGMNLSSMDLQAQDGAKADLGVIWIGPWTLSSGWGGPDQQFTKASNAGVTPVIQYYYWGDDISRDCLANGCQSDLQGARKDKAGWDELGRQLTVHLNSQMKGKRVIIVLETEFNKNDVYNYEPLDAMLAEKATYLKTNYAGAEVVLGLGNWGREHWGTWDRAAAACDATGIQGMRGSTRNSATSYESLAQATLDGAKALQQRFGKPVYITDIALSSYPEPEWLSLQESALRPFFARIGEFKAAGVKGMVYRDYKDSPDMDTKNYFGEAERHWGLAWATNGTHKPAMKVWIDGVKKERGAPATSTPAPAPPPPSGTFAPTFQIKAPNEWWQEVFIQNTGHTISGVQVRVNGGAWHTMEKRDWGAWTTSVNSKAGSKVEFLATASTGAKAQSMPFTWLDGQTTKGTASSAAPTTTTTASPTSSTSPTSSSSPAPTTTSSPTPTTTTPTPAPTTTTTAAPVTALQKEAEAFAVKTGGSREADASASAGQRWNQHQNGYIAQSFDAPAGTYRVTVWSAAQIKSSGLSTPEPPVIRILVDGKLARQVAVTSPSFTQQTIDVPLTSGRHELRIEYANDESGLLADRNLLVDRALVRTA